ncbi:MAG TPA: potassium transporter Kup [Gemmatimonadaceae bacterium]|nr:potassium transporter Kup [Gemmatimonadaceae bacterium]
MPEPSADPPPRSTPPPASAPGGAAAAAAAPSGAPPAPAAPRASGEAPAREGGHHAPQAPSGRYLAVLSLSALGIVFGDIGTSPLYAFRESLHEGYGVAVSAANVLGILSLIFWALVLVISVKYLTFVLRADNRGEGGILALTSLVTPIAVGHRGARRKLVLLGLFGAALLYGDGMITPAISVLSAVEGLEVATPVFTPYIVPITIAILVALFAAQRFGTGGVGRVFGPVMLLWFTVLAALGLYQIVQAPGVLQAVNPLHGARFFADNGVRGFLVLGSVFLAVTGAEAMYADMGHFGKRPIRLAWFVLVFPALLLNYFGQGALLLAQPEAVENPFYHMGPDWALFPLVGVATVATVIASQAVISGAFSLTMQAAQLGYAPRVHIEHTSSTERGQIYIPGINWALMIACIGLVVGFGSSTNLAAAYGVAVTTDMLFATILLAIVARQRWRWGLPRVVGLISVFLVIDLAFWGANIVKVPAGGWFPLVVAALVFTLMTTWKRGRQILAQRLQEQLLPRTVFLENLRRHPPPRVPGTAIYMYGNRQGTPPALLHSLKHFGVLHERVVFLAAETEEAPYLAPDERTTIEELGEGVYQIVLHYGFMEDVDVPSALADLHREGRMSFEPMKTSYFLGRETIIAARHRAGMQIWREKLFGVMARNARSATSFFRLPPNRVVELGAQIEL